MNGAQTAEGYRRGALVMRKNVLERHLSAYLLCLIPASRDINSSPEVLNPSDGTKIQPSEGSIVGEGCASKSGRCS
ncbi:hypothetical protein PSPTOT1_0561 [Pseudomonas syringae pv. tomato T1]|nr:hypothetical protein PSPTOT1_0561 [Pseudomonas syringae pv. tomato T1]